MNGINPYTASVEQISPNDSKLSKHYRWRKTELSYVARASLLYLIVLNLQKTEMGK